MSKKPSILLALFLSLIAASEGESFVELQSIVTQLVVKDNSPLALSFDYYELDQLSIIQQHVDTVTVEVHQVYVRFTVVASCKSNCPDDCEDQMRLCNAQFALNGSDVNDDMCKCEALPDIQFEAQNDKSEGRSEQKPERSLVNMEEDLAQNENTIKDNVIMENLPSVGAVSKHEPNGEVSNQRDSNSSSNDEDDLGIKDNSNGKKAEYPIVAYEKIHKVKDFNKKELEETLVSVNLKRGDGRPGDVAYPVQDKKTHSEDGYRGIKTARPIHANNDKAHRDLALEVLEDEQATFIPYRHRDNPPVGNEGHEDIAEHSQGKVKNTQVEYGRFRPVSDKLENPKPDSVQASNAEDDTTSYVQRGIGELPEHDPLIGKFEANPIEVTKPNQKMKNGDLRENKNTKEVKPVKSGQLPKKKSEGLSSIELLMFIQTAVEEVNDASKGKLKMTLSKILNIYQLVESSETTYSFEVECIQAKDVSQKCNILCELVLSQKTPHLLDYICSPVSPQFDSRDQDLPAPRDQNRPTRSKIQLMAE